MPENPSGSPVLRVLFVSLAIVAIVAGLRAASVVLAPMSLALFFAMILLPLVGLLKRMGMPRSLAVPVVMILAAGGVVGMILLIWSILIEINSTLPAYLPRIQALEAEALAILAERGVPVPETLIPSFNPERLMNYAGVALRGFAGVVMGTFLVFLLASFILADMAAWPAKVRRAVGREDLDLSRFSGISSGIQRYLILKTVISLVTGICVGVMTWVLGLELPLLWGFLAFLFNYIPNIGSVIAAAPAILFALLQFGLAGAIVVSAGYILIEVVFGNILDPVIVGRGTGLSGLTVLLSLLIWGWIWGWIGMVLSLPLTLALRVGLEHSPDTRWVAALLSPLPPSTKPRPPESEAV